MDWITLYTGAGLIALAAMIYFKIVCPLAAQSGIWLPLYREMTEEIGEQVSTVSQNDYVAPEVAAVAPMAADRADTGLSARLSALSGPRQAAIIDIMLDTSAREAGVRPTQTTLVEGLIALGWTVSEIRTLLKGDNGVLSQAAEQARLKLGIDTPRRVVTVGKGAEFREVEV